jgi:DNA-binding transcriptional LysR family regulator
LASADYVARFGLPRRWDALDGHRMIGFRSSATGNVLPLEFMVEGVRKTAMLPASLSVNGADTYEAACRQGLGLIQVPRYSVEAEIANGALIECLADTPPSPTPVTVLYPRSRQLSLRVRIFIDWVAKEYARWAPPERTAATRALARHSRL